MSSTTLVPQRYSRTPSIIVCLHVQYTSQVDRCIPLHLPYGHDMTGPYETRASSCSQLPRDRPSEAWNSCRAAFVFPKQRQEAAGWRPWRADDENRAA